jgi:hypothetical protein
VQVSLLSLSWGCCPCCNGVAIIDAQASLQSRHLCCHCNNVVALVAMALLPLSRVSLPSSMRRHLFHCHNGVVSHIALAPLLTLHGRCCPCFPGIVVFIALTSLPSRYMGVITIFAPALLHPLSWRVCSVALFSLLLSRWCCCPWCTGISAIVVQASLPSLSLHCAIDLQASLPLLSWHVLSRRQRGRPCLFHYRWKNTLRLESWHI